MQIQKFGEQYEHFGREWAKIRSAYSSGGTNKLPEPQWFRGFM
jgi:hypothetical protein